MFADRVLLHRNTDIIHECRNNFNAYFRHLAKLCKLCGGQVFFCAKHTIFQRAFQHPAQSPYSFHKVGIVSTSFFHMHSCANIPKARFAPQSRNVQLKMEKVSLKIENPRHLPMPGKDSYTLIFLFPRICMATTTPTSPKPIQSVTRPGYTSSRPPRALIIRCMGFMCRSR